MIFLVVEELPDSHEGFEMEQHDGVMNSFCGVLPLRMVIDMHAEDAVGVVGRGHRSRRIQAESQTCRYPHEYSLHHGLMLEPLRWTICPEELQLVQAGADHCAGHLKVPMEVVHCLLSGVEGFVWKEHLEKSGSSAVRPSLAQFLVCPFAATDICPPHV